MLWTTTARDKRGALPPSWPEGQFTPQGIFDQKKQPGRAIGSFTGSGSGGVAEGRARLLSNRDTAILQFQIADQQFGLRRLQQVIAVVGRRS